MPRKNLNMKTVIQAAIDMANEHGVDSVTIASLAKRLKIKSPSLYNHIEGLDDLRNKMAIEGLDRLYQVLVNASAGRSGGEAIHAQAKAYVHFARQQPGLYEITLRAHVSTGPGVEQSGEKIVDLIMRVLKSYNLKGDDAIHSVRGFRSLLHGFASLEQNGGFNMPVDSDASLHFLIETFLAGLDVKK